MFRSRLVLHAMCISTVLLLLGAPRALAYDADDTLQAIDQASATTGVAALRLYRVVGCETGWTFNPYARGDGGTSLGAAQLHRGGNALPTFYSAGYTDPFDPYQSVEFMARALNGEFLGLGAWTWSCA